MKTKTPKQHTGMQSQGKGKTEELGAAATLQGKDMHH